VKKRQQLESLEKKGSFRRHTPLLALAITSKATVLIHLLFGYCCILDIHVAHCTSMNLFRQIHLFSKNAIALLKQTIDYSLDKYT